MRTPIGALYKVPGGTLFFTPVAAGRAPILTTPLARTLLREVTRECRTTWPFEIVAMVRMLDHLRVSEQRCGTAPDSP